MIKVCSLLALCIVSFLDINAQNDRTFPNVSATFSEDWPCQDPTNGPWTISLYYTYNAQPSIQHQGLEWGEFGP